MSLANYTRLSTRKTIGTKFVELCLYQPGTCLMFIYISISANERKKEGKSSWTERARERDEKNILQR